MGLFLRPYLPSCVLPNSNSDNQPIHSRFKLILGENKFICGNFNPILGENKSICGKKDDSSLARKVSHLWIEEIILG